MKKFLTGLLLAIWDVIILLATIFVLFGVPTVFLLGKKQCVANSDVVLDFIVVSLWGYMLPDYFKNIGHHSKSLYKRLKGEPNE